MLKKTVIQNRAERDDFLGRPFLERDSTKTFKSSLAHKPIKVVIGPRRAGKSVQCFLALKGKKFAYLNFDDESFLRLNDYDDILVALREVYGDVNFYFFDEIQNLPDWELFANKLQRRGYNLILTGSNANLLSCELGTALTGRHRSLTLLPLGLAEFLRSRELDWDEDSMHIPRHRGDVLRATEEFILHGGFPEVAIDGLEAQEYLGTLLDAILYKDIVVRHNIRSARLLSDLCLFMLSNVARKHTWTGLKNAVGAGSVHTVESYVSYLKDAFLFFSLDRYNQKIKEILRSPRKIYVVDNGFLAARARQVSEDHGHLLENAVFVELLRQGKQPDKDLFHYRTRSDLEIDFLLLDGPRPETLLQVAFTIEQPRTKKREIRALIQAADELKVQNLLIVTWDTETSLEHNGRSVKVIPFWKFCRDRRNADESR